MNSRSGSAPATPTRARVIAAFLTIYLIWGSTYLFIKWVVADVPPFLAGAMRHGIAGVLPSEVSCGDQNHECIFRASACLRIVVECSLFTKHVMIVLGETMRLVPDILEESKTVGPTAQHERFGLPREEDLFLSLGQREQGGRCDPQ